MTTEMKRRQFSRLISVALLSSTTAGCLNSSDESDTEREPNESSEIPPSEQYDIQTIQSMAADTFTSLSTYDYELELIDKRPRPHEKHLLNGTFYQRQDIWGGEYSNFIGESIEVESESGISRQNNEITVSKGDLSATFENVTAADYGTTFEVDFENQDQWIYEHFWDELEDVLTAEPVNPDSHPVANTEADYDLTLAPRGELIREFYKKIFLRVMGTDPVGFDSLTLSDAEITVDLQFEFRPDSTSFDFTKDTFSVHTEGETLTSDFKMWPPQNDR